MTFALRLGNDAATGIHLTPTAATIAGKWVYYGGNANNLDRWGNEKRHRAEGLTVAGDFALNGSLTALSTKYK